MGNQIKVEPLGYKLVAMNKTDLAHVKDWDTSTVEKMVQFSFNVTNLGLSDQIHDDLKLRITNANLHVHKPKHKEHKLRQMNSKLSLAEQKEAQMSEQEWSKKYLASQRPPSNFLKINGLKARSSSTVSVAVFLGDPANVPHFYQNYSGPLETAI